MHEPTLVIMAAGMGSRFGGLKQITPISGDDEVILDFSLYDAVMAGFKKAVIIIKEENREDFRRLIDDKVGDHIEIKYAYQSLDDIPAGFKVPEGRVKPWGTTHAVLSAKDLIDDNFVVINADDYYGPSAFQTIYDFLVNAEDGDKYNYAMVGYQIENTLTENGHVARGVCQVDDKKFLTKIDERLKIMWRGEKIAFTEDDGESWTEVAKGTTVSMNFWGFTHSFLDEAEARFPAFLESCEPMKGEYLLPRTVDDLLKEGKATVKVLTSADRWYGVTYKEDKEFVINAIQSLKDKGIYPEKLWR